MHAHTHTRTHADTVSHLSFFLLSSLVRLRLEEIGEQVGPVQWLPHRGGVRQQRVVGGHLLVHVHFRLTGEDGLFLDVDGLDELLNFAVRACCSWTKFLMLKQLRAEAVFMLSSFERFEIVFGVELFLSASFTSLSWSHSRRRLAFRFVLQSYHGCSCNHSNEFTFKFGILFCPKKAFTARF